MIQVSMTTGDLEAILRQHEIPALEWGQWSALVFQGKRPEPQLLAQLQRGNRAAALNHILSDLSEAYWKRTGIKFPPPRPALRKAG